MKAYCINLLSRQDRFDKTYPLLTDRGFKVRRYVAHRLHPAWMGCTASHLGALASIGKAPFAIFEDDLEFINPIEIMHKAIEQAGDFDLLFLGCDPLEPMIRVDENLLRLSRAYQAHAIIYGSDEVVDFILSKRNETRKNDVFLAEQVMPNFKCYATYPMVAKQVNGYSDLQNRDLNFDYITDKFNSMIE